MYCKNCGAIIDNDSKFCNKCGISVQPLSQSDFSQQNTTSAPYCLYMAATNLNHFEIKSADGFVRYYASYTNSSNPFPEANIYSYPNYTKSLTIRQQQNITIAAKNYDILSSEGPLITEVLQKVHFTKYEFQLPHFGIVVKGSIFSNNFVFTRGNQTVASVHKNVHSQGDCYELKIFDSTLEQIVLAAILVIKMASSR